MHSGHFKDAYIDDISVDYFYPILSDVFDSFGSQISIAADVGCGNGLCMEYLKAHYSVSLYGFDSSRYAIEMAQAKGAGPVAYATDFSAQPLEARDEMFDLIICKDVLEHLMHPEFCMREIARIVKKGGLFLVSVPNDFNLIKRIQFLFDPNTDTYRNFPGAKEWDRPHVRFFTAGGLQELLEARGFTIIKNYSAHFAVRIPYMHRLPGYMPVARYAAGKNPTQFASAITYLARKLC